MAAEKSFKLMLVAYSTFYNITLCGLWNDKFPVLSNFVFLIAKLRTSKAKCFCIVLYAYFYCNDGFLCENYTVKFLLLRFEMLICSRSRFQMFWSWWIYVPYRLHVFPIFWFQCSVRRFTAILQPRKQVYVEYCVL